MKHDEREIYLGDGIYAVDRSHEIELYTSNGFSKTNIIIFESNELMNLLFWLKNRKIIMDFQSE